MIEVEGFGAVFGLGALGGALMELLRWWKIREAGRFPAYSRRVGYWVITVLMILAGGGLAVLYGLDKRAALLPVNIGAATPAIIASFSSKAEKDSSIRDDKRQLDGGGKYTGVGVKLRQFLAFGG